MLLRTLFDRPYFITPHAGERFRERIAPGLSDDATIRALQAALQRPVFETPGREEVQLLGARYGHARFVAVVRSGPRWPVVLTVGEWWRWHECRALWPESKREQPPADPEWMGTDGPPLTVPEPKAEDRPCLRDRKALTRYRQDFVGRYCGRRTPEWMAAQLGMSTSAVRHFMWRHGLTPTGRDDLLLSGDVADLLGCSQQWVVRLVKRGRLTGWRNPGGVWWLISRESVRLYLEQQGQKADDVRLRGESGWPGVRLSQHRSAWRQSVS